MEGNLLFNAKRLFQFINIKRKSDGFPPSLSYSNTISSDPTIISNFFATFFSQSYTKHHRNPDPHYFNYLNGCPQSSLSSVVITEDMVVAKIASLKDNLSPGPDGIPSSVLKKCIHVLSEPLLALFKLSLSQGVFPLIWKDSFIFPIHKQGNKTEIVNYRPIAKLSSIPKLFESLVYDSVYFSCQPLFSPAQHGFLKGKSTTTNLIEFVSKVLTALEKGNEVDVIYTDYSKAFDKISHKIIYLKLRVLGFPPSFIKWISSYLEDRTYRVLFRNTVSNPILATSGVPQGSHLGPLLFVLSVNDVNLIIKNADILRYADDTNIFKVISSSSDSMLLQVQVQTHNLLPEE